MSTVVWGITPCSIVDMYQNQHRPPCSRCTDFTLIVYIPRNVFIYPLLLKGMFWYGMYIVYFFIIWWQIRYPVCLLNLIWIWRMYSKWWIDWPINVIVPSPLWYLKWVFMKRFPPQNFVFILVIQTELHNQPILTYKSEIGLWSVSVCFVVCRNFSCFWTHHSIRSGTFPHFVFK